MIPIVIIYVCAFSVISTIYVEGLNPEIARVKRLPGGNSYSAVCLRNTSTRVKLLSDDNAVNQEWCGDYWYRKYGLLPDSNYIVGSPVINFTEGVKNVELTSNGGIIFEFKYRATHRVQITYCTQCGYAWCPYREFSLEYKITNFRCLSKNLAPLADVYSDKMTVRCGIKSSRFTQQTYWVRNGLEKLSSLDGHHEMTYHPNDPGMFGRYECTQVFYDPLFTKVTYKFEISPNQTAAERSNMQKILKADCVDSKDRICRKVGIEIEYDKGILLNQRMKGFKLMYRHSGEDSIIEDTVKFSNCQTTEAGVTFNWIKNISIPGILSIQPIDFFGTEGNQLSYIII